MKASTLFISLTMVVSTASLSFAGPGHSHDHGHDHSHGHDHGAPAKLDEKGLIAAASKGVSSLLKQKHQIEGKTLAAVWGKTPEASKSVSKKGNGYSVIKFEDKDNKKALYVLLSDAGEVFDANFSGQFSGLKE